MISHDYTHDSVIYRIFENILKYVINVVDYNSLRK